MTDLIAVCKDCHSGLHNVKQHQQNNQEDRIVQKRRKTRRLAVEQDEGESLFIIPFPKSKFYNKPIEDLPDSYLEWLSEQEWFEAKFSKGYEAITKELEYRYTFGKHL